jgi:hypothetical protein
MSYGFVRAGSLVRTSRKQALGALSEMLIRQ